VPTFAAPRDARAKSTTTRQFLPQCFPKSVWRISPQANALMTRTKPPADHQAARLIGNSGAPNLLRINCDSATAGS
jgi:hypothetical protein